MEPRPKTKAKKRKEKRRKKNKKRKGKDPQVGLHYSRRTRPDPSHEVGVR